MIVADNLDLLSSADSRCDVDEDGGLCTFERGAAENLTFSASPEAGEVGSVTFALSPTWLDPELSNNVDRVVIGDGTSATAEASTAAVGPEARRAQGSEADARHQRTPRDAHHRKADRKADREAREPRRWRGWAGLTRPERRFSDFS